MREITTHKVNGCNDAITITVLDEPGQGGACHKYHAEWPDRRIDPPGCGHVGGHSATIEFQNGPIPEVGTNGVTHEVLLAVLIDSLEGFQNGPYACRANESALAHLKDAMHCLHERTKERLARGVEGTHKV